MASIVDSPKPDRVRCNKCRATIEFLPEEIEVRNGTDYGGGPDGWRRVKCPRTNCPGHGYIERW